MFSSWEPEHECVDSVSALHILTGGECACFISMISLTSEITKTLKSLGVVTFVNQTCSNYNIVPDSLLQQRKAIPSLCHGDGLKQLLERDTSTGLV